MGQYAGAYNTKGKDNVFLGTNAGQVHKTGDNNVALGNGAAHSADGMENSVIIGTDAGYNTSGSADVFIGYEAGHKNTSGSYNVYMGYQAGYENTKSENNIFIGTQAGHLTNGTKKTIESNPITHAIEYPYEGSNNVFLGNKAGFTNSTGMFNTFLGNASGFSNSNGKYNTFIGNSTGYSNTTGEKNVFMGYFAGYSNTDGEHSVIIGNGAGMKANADRSVFIGNNAGYNTTGYDNVFLGTTAGYTNTTGARNVFIGEQAGFYNVLGYGNVMIGDMAGKNHKGYEESDAALYEGSTYGINDDWNIFIGNSAGYNHIKGTRNVMLGNQAGHSNKNGDRNVFIGSDAGFYETGSNKLIISNSKTYDLIYGDFAAQTLKINGALTVTGATTFSGGINGNLSTTGAITGGSLTVSGKVSAQYINTSNTITVSTQGTNYSSSSITIGGTTYTNWIGCGVYGKAYTSNTNNYGLYGEANGATGNYGVYGFANSSTGTNYGIYGKASGATTNWAGYFDGNVKITSNLEPGSDQNGTIGTSTNRWKQAYFKNENGGAALIAENANLNSYAASFVGDITVSNKIYGTLNSSSDARLKKNVQTIDGALDKVLKLRGVSYYWKNKEEMGADSTNHHFDNAKHIGVIAQELEEVFPELVSDDKEGFKTVEYTGLAPILIEAMKEQQQQIETLKNDKAELKKEVDELRKMVEELMKK